MPGSFVIVSGVGLAPPETLITLEQFEQIASIPIDARDARYREPLDKACRILEELADRDCDFVLLGSRGGLLLRAVRAGRQLTYIPAGKLTHHGPRPPKLPKTLRGGLV